MSYDPVDVLAGFAERHGITFPLLADEGSAVITALGLLNLHVHEQYAHMGKPVWERHSGLPYPGTITVDERGIVVEKWFEDDQHIRPSATSLLADAADGDVTPAVYREADAYGVRVAAWLPDDSYQPLQVQTLGVTVDIPEGLHVYADPVPDGFVPLAVRIGPEGTVQVRRQVALPDGRPFVLPGFDERFFVHEGRIELRVPFMVVPDLGDVDIQLEFRFQACGDSVCHPPTDLGLSLPFRCEPDRD